MTEESSLKKVIVRKRDGGVVAGFTSSGDLQPTTTIIARDGKEQKFALSDLKALFFVRDFEGDPKYEEIRFLTRKEPSTAVWVRLTMFDGEILEGRIENDLEVLTAEGLFLWPSDGASNNEYAYIPKSAVKDFQILSAD